MGGGKVVGGGKVLEEKRKWGGGLYRSWRVPSVSKQRENKGHAPDFTVNNRAEFSIGIIPNDRILVGSGCGGVTV